MTQQPDLTTLSIGTRVITTQDAGSTDWCDSTRANVRWGVPGTVVAVFRGHGLCYEVKHDDGTSAPYEPAEVTLEDWRRVEDNPIPPVCPRCAAEGDVIDNLGDSEHCICLRCGLCWPPGGHAEPWPCAVCMIGDDVSLQRVRAAMREISIEERNKMFAAAVFLGEPGCTELRRLLTMLHHVDEVLTAGPTADEARITLVDSAIRAHSQGAFVLEDLIAIRNSLRGQS